MCGFLVVAGRDQRAISHRALGRLRRRGPDGVGFWTDGIVTMLHARLAVINPGDEGLQPVEHAGAAMVFNGEIYNWARIRQEGERTDAAVLLRAYLDEDISVLRRMNGFWAFAIRRGYEVHLVRDQLGIKPLYYAKHAGGLIAGSTLRAVRDALPEKPVLNHAAMSEWARYQMVFGEHTFYKGIERVLPGERVIWNERTGELHHEQYEDIWATEGGLPNEAWVDQAQEILVDAAFDATVADVPFTATCSGGLDSSVVTRLTEPAMAYHSNYSGPDFNETIHAKAVVEGTSTRLFVHNAHEDVDLVERLQDIVKDQDDLSVGSVVLPLDELMGEIKRRYRVCLLGTGGDELFGGYVRLDIAMGTCKHPNYAPTFERMKRLGLEDTFSRYEHLHRKGATDAYRFFDATEATKGFANAAQWDFAHEARSMLGFERRQFLPALLTIDDRISGRHGVEGRPALLHQALVRHVTEVDPEFILQHPLKQLAKWVFEPWLPASVMARDDKKGFPTPVGAMVNANAAKIREFVSSSPFRSLYDLAKVRWTTEDPYDRGIFGLLQLDCWLRS